MITGVRIENWKAYDSLELDLGPGTNFLVARNGVGKTSFVEAIRWALLGTNGSGINAEACRRGDRDVVVEVALGSPGEPSARIRRTAVLEGKRGKPKDQVAFSVGPRESNNASEWQEWLSNAWGASPTLLARLMNLPEYAVWEELTSPISADVNSAIRMLLRLDVLQDLSKVAGTQFRKAERLARESRAVTQDELQAAQDAVAEATMEHDEALARHTALRGVYEARVATREHAENRATWLRASHTWSRKRSQLTKEALGLARKVAEENATAEDASPVTSADGARRLVSDIRASVAQRLAEVRALQEFTESHRRDLVADANCPVCLRPMDADTVHAADQQHSSLLRELAEQVEAREHSLTQTQRVLDRLNEIVVLLREPVPPEPIPTGVVSEEAQSVDFSLSDEQLLDAGREAAANAEQLRDTLGAHRAALAALNDQSSAWDQALSMTRRAALARVVEATAGTLSDDLTGRAADPVTTLVRDQWKKLPFGDSIEIEPNGQFVITRQGRKLGYEHLSGGEKAQIVLIYRVAALKALTRIPMLILDEPLEHLDPRNRWRFGRMISALCQSGALTQTLITTYEESLARRLVRQASDPESSELVSLRYLAED